MKNIVVACNTLRDEVRFVVKDLHVDDPILWVDSGLHNFPEKLNKAIQDQINRIENVENIILLFGSCGNSLAGLSSPSARIIFPRVDDCISLFLGGNERRRMLEKQAPSYYLTRGYLRNEHNIWNEYTYCLNKYGEKKAGIIFKKMLGNYKRLRIIDTGVYDVEEVLAETNNIARQFELIHEVIEGSLKFLYKALKCRWDQDFVIVEPGQPVTFYHTNPGLQK